MWTTAQWPVADRQVAGRRLTMIERDVPPIGRDEALLAAEARERSDSRQT